MPLALDGLAVWIQEVDDDGAAFADMGILGLGIDAVGDALELDLLSRTIDGPIRHQIDMLVVRRTWRFRDARPQHSQRKDLMIAVDGPHESVETVLRERERAVFPRLLLGRLLPAVAAAGLPELNGHPRRGTAGLGPEDTSRQSAVVPHHRQSQIGHRDGKRPHDLVILGEILVHRRKKDIMPRFQIRGNRELRHMFLVVLRIVEGDLPGAHAEELGRDVLADLLAVVPIEAVVEEVVLADVVEGDARDPEDDLREIAGADFDFRLRRGPGPFRSNRKLRLLHLRNQ